MTIVNSPLAAGMNGQGRSPLYQPAARPGAQAAPSQSSSARAFAPLPPPVPVTTKLLPASKDDRPRADPSAAAQSYKAVRETVAPR